MNVRNTPQYGRSLSVRNSCWSPSGAGTFGRGEVVSRHRDARVRGGHERAGLRAGMRGQQLFALAEMFLRGFVKMVGHFQVGQVAQVEKDGVDVARLAKQFDAAAQELE